MAKSNFKNWKWWMHYVLLVAVITVFGWISMGIFRLENLFLFTPLLFVVVVITDVILHALFNLD